MRYPEFLKENDTIGLVAPSFGVIGYPYQERFESACGKFEGLGYELVKCPSLYKTKKARSTTGKKRAKEFMDFYLDDDIDFLFSVAGGEFMVEMLPYVDFEKIKQSKPKYFMGYSDNTCLTFTLPVLADTAAIYGSCFGSFGMSKWHRSINEAYEVITGDRHKQRSYAKYCVDDTSKMEGHALDGYNCTEKVVVKSLKDEDVQISGRLIGGCLDVLACLVGTPFGQVDEFIDRYEDDGIIWFLEACDLNVLSMTRALWQLKQAGWFRNCKGIILGRPVHPDSIFNITVKSAIKDSLGDLKVPIIYDMDFGHVAPSWTIISGSYATIKKAKDKATIKYQFK